MNYQTLPTYKLTRRMAALMSIRDKGTVLGQPISRRGYRCINHELSTIEAELESRQPILDVTLLDEAGLPVGVDTLEGGDNAR